MKLAEKIHTGGRKFSSRPYRVYYLDMSDGETQTVIISVPKKLFKRAVRRNLIRRRTREALRLMKEEYPALDGRHLMLVYTATEILDYAAIYEGLGAALGKIPPLS